MVNHRAPSACTCPPHARAVDPSSCAVHAPAPRAAQTPRVRAARGINDNTAECRFPRAERTRESVQAEEAYHAQLPPALRPLAAHRLEHATALYETLRAFDVSNNRFADMIGVNEKQVRKMLEGLTPIQSTITSAMPVDMALDFLGRVSALRGAVKSGMQREIDRLRKARDLRAVLEAQRQLVELAAWLSGGGA